MIVHQVKRLHNITIVTIAPLSLTRSKKEKVFDCSAKKRIFAAIISIKNNHYGNTDKRTCNAFAY
jgi:hypothetical protein